MLARFTHYSPLTIGIKKGRNLRQKTTFRVYVNKAMSPLLIGSLGKFSMKA